MKTTDILILLQPPHGMYHPYGETGYILSFQAEEMQGA